MFVWANDLMRGDDAKRSVVIASMNMFSIAVYILQRRQEKQEELAYSPGVEGQIAKESLEADSKA